MRLRTLNELVPQDTRDAQYKLFAETPAQRYFGAYAKEPNMKFRAAIVLIALVSGMATADDRMEYNRRAAEADRAAYRQLDRDGDGRLTQEEVQGDVGFRPRFDDIDINRDGIVTPNEMRRYLEQAYEVPGTSIIGL